MRVSRRAAATSLAVLVVACVAPSVVPGAASADQGCNQWAYAYLTYGDADRYIPYYARISTFPSNFGTKTDTRSEVIRGHHAWLFTVNPCGHPDQDNVTLDYVSDTTFGAHTYDDGINVVDWGKTENLNQPGCQAAIACTPYGADAAGRIIWSDIRFNDEYAWSSDSDRGHSGYLDVRNVATHEAGHRLGLANLSNVTEQGWLSMYVNFSYGEIRKRDLGSGDIWGMRGTYPSP